MQVGRHASGQACRWSGMQATHNKSHQSNNVITVSRKNKLLFPVTVHVSTTFLNCMDLSGLLAVIASFSIKKMSIFTSYKILHGTVGIRLGNENQIIHPTTAS